MKIVLSEEVGKLSTEALGLDPTLYDLSSIEAIACLLRRTAGFLCPCPERTLVQAVLGSLKHILDNTEELETTISETLESLIVNGDLLELENEDERVLLYTAPPSFICRESGAVMLLGITPDNMSLLPDEIERRISFINHTRMLNTDNQSDICEELLELGLIELSDRTWLKLPKNETAVEHLTRMNTKLENVPYMDDIPGLELLDSNLPVRFYKGRWTDYAKQTGRFVGRRKQAYGAKLWCYIEIYEEGKMKFFDFPLSGSPWRGHDEAWRLQAAIDFERGYPQQLRTRHASNDDQFIDLFSPIPMWARRRWDTIGEVSPNLGCLLSYKFSENEIAEELKFAKNNLWLIETL